MGKQLYSDAREAVRALLRQARKDAGLSQVDLAAKLGRPQSYVSEYESSTRKLDFVAVGEVLDACQADLVEFAKAYIKATKGIPK